MEKTAQESLSLHDLHRAMEEGRRGTLTFDQVREALVRWSIKTLENSVESQQFRVMNSRLTFPDGV